MSNSRKKKTTPTPKKKCNTCHKDRTHTYFFKVESSLYPDGMINTCRDCVRQSIDINNIEEVIGFLRQIDKPFIQEYWDKALESKNHPLGEYIRKVNSLQQVKDKDFDDSKGIGFGKSSDVVGANIPDSVETDSGKTITFSDDFITKWGIGYKKHEYLAMEKFYQDMKDTHEIHTPIHKSMLKKLSKLSIKMDRYLESDNMGDFEKANRQFEASMKSAGFRPVDRQGIDDATGLRSFSQIFEEVEKKGFRKPPPPVFDEDVVDAMITSLANYYHRLVGKQILADIPDDVKQEIEDFFEDDLTPVEINNEEYEDLDFSVDEMESDIDLEDEE
jgi:hypothetical protein